jgi:outer membrane protein with beta-barrel domain
VRAGLSIAALFFSTAAFAQSSASPGPYVIDLHGLMSGLPSGSAFHPVLPVNTLVPRRGFGLGAGAHVYLVKLGPARLGVGLEIARARGTAMTPATTTSTTTTATTSSSATATPALSAASPIDTATTITLVTPQVSFNFGARDGWSYLSGGYGSAQIHGAASGQLVAPAAGAATLVRDEGRASAVNYGGGARWFIREHIAVGFDLRFHRIAAVGTQPATRVFALSVGLSVR